MRDPARQLLRVLRRSALQARCPVTLAHEREILWATITFAGARHVVRAVGDPATLPHWLMGLPEADLPLHGWFVASCAAEIAGGEATIELLLLEQ